ncbi:pre-mRNA-splicing factor PRP46-like [Rhinatrema bivittatum]|uniref:pre-mRNA-splicing factor PRP46-like n=1 Tax=Rhinatrema bivittatum TaxID=194408 RepID=UPI00112D05F5|nr:pre-mRNA-splicing factor PRP46-like [Rhinatrema bivittatum]
MSRRIKEAILLSKELGSSDESGDASDEEEELPHSGLCVRYHVPLSKDFHSIYSLHFSPSGKQLAVGFGNGAIQIVNMETGALESALCSGHRTRQAVTAMSYHPLSNKLLVAAGADGMISIYDIESTNVVSFSEHGNEINALDFCLDGSVYATAGKDRHIRLYDSHTNEVLHVLEGPDIMNADDLTLTSGHSRRIFALKFHPNEYHTFLTGGWDNSIKIWDKRMAKEARRVINGPHICGPSIDIKDNKVLTGSWVARNALQLWDYRSAQLEKNIPFPGKLFHGEFLYAAKFCNKNVVIAGGSGTYSACAVDHRTDQILGEVSLTNKTVQTLDVTRCGKYVAVAGVGGNLHIAELC